MPSWGAWALILFVVLAPQCVLAMLNLGTHTQPVQLVAPTVASPWHATATPPSTWVPAFQNASATLHTGLADGHDQPVGLQVSYYRQQDYERKLVSSENVMVVSQDPVWARVGSGGVDARLQGRPLRVDSTVLRQQALGMGKGEGRLLAWRFYWVNNGFTASNYMGKIQGALSRITGRGDDGANVVIYTPLSSAENAVAEASARLQDYLDRQGDALAGMLEQPQGRN